MVWMMGSVLLLWVEEVGNRNYCRAVVLLELLWLMNIL
jgi:hypothetical protein